MKATFTKMQGCGNDYIYFDCFSQSILHPEKTSIALSDRHFGVGGDGIILVCPSTVADAKMRIFNLDGSEGKMCGNGIRCVGKFLYDHGICRKPEMDIDTLSGVKHLTLHFEGSEVASVTVDMGSAILSPEQIPVRLEGDCVIGREVEVAGTHHTITCVSMGNPHCVLFGDDPDLLALSQIGLHFEKSPLFPESVNTEFVQLLDSHTLKMRVWERGSGETWACGTGACAAAVAAVENGFCRKNEEITVHLRGGDLVIRYTDETVWMTGGAVTVFEGSIDI